MHTVDVSPLTRLECQVLISCDGEITSEVFEGRTPSLELWTSETVINAVICSPGTGQLPVSATPHVHTGVQNTNRY